MNSILPTSQQGRVITFYSYKGGVGRTMLLSNIAWLLAQNGYRVLVVDWDLEAPGLHEYFGPVLPPGTDLKAEPGLIDMVRRFLDSVVSRRKSKKPITQEWIEREVDVLRYTLPIQWDNFDRNGFISLMHAGRFDGQYARRFNTFDWARFYDNYGGNFLNEMLSQMRHQFDFTLIDSRTGAGDTSNICTAHLPDTLVACTILNNQSVQGIVDTLNRARNKSQSVYGRTELRTLPLIVRVDLSEKERVQAGRVQAREVLSQFVPEEFRGDAVSYWEDTEVLYVPYYAYEEVPAVFAENMRNSRSISSLLSTYERIAGRVIGETKPLLSESYEPDVCRETLAKYQRGEYLGGGAGAKEQSEGLVARQLEALRVKVSEAQAQTEERQVYSNHRAAIVVAFLMWFILHIVWSSHEVSTVASWRDVAIPALADRTDEKPFLVIEDLELASWIFGKQQLEAMKTNIALANENFSSQLDFVGNFVGSVPDTYPNVANFPFPKKATLVTAVKTLDWNELKSIGSSLVSEQQSILELIARGAENFNGSSDGEYLSKLARIRIDEFGLVIENLETSQRDLVEIGEELSKAPAFRPFWQSKGGVYLEILFGSVVGCMFSRARFWKQIYRRSKERPWVNSLALISVTIPIAILCGAWTFESMWREAFSYYYRSAMMFFLSLLLGLASSYFMFFQNQKQFPITSARERKKNRGASAITSIALTMLYFTGCATSPEFPNKTTNSPKQTVVDMSGNSLILPEVLQTTELYTDYLEKGHRELTTHLSDSTDSVAGLLGEEWMRRVLATGTNLVYAAADSFEQDFEEAIPSLGYEVILSTNRNDSPFASLLSERSSELTKLETESNLNPNDGYRRVLVSLTREQIARIREGQYRFNLNVVNKIGEISHEERHLLQRTNLIGMSGMISLPDLSSYVSSEKPSVFGFTAGQQFFGAVRSTASLEDAFTKFSNDIQRDALSYNSPIPLRPGDIRIHLQGLETTRLSHLVSKLESTRQSALERALDRLKSEMRTLITNLVSDLRNVSGLEGTESFSRFEDSVLNAVPSTK